ncbi:hypothetical protein GQ43DRAFT_472079 [Delitschia confertaspora ATCC 74209]|uniref:BHLH domain-containing protein n=1 Tax=Delitschia confertaspora ATCC 74209 TaxID=1513339 RepID=A0A9P4JKP1_9PLEO|nr:hypothetical protein GQ43DRAFT_472079 [Delitschia confertaspora ATCC 74209]
MEHLHQQRPVPPPPPAGAPGSVTQPQALPSISSLMPSSDQGSMRPRQHSEARDARDSGNWSISQSKHSSGVSNGMGLQLQTILNAEDSPTRHSVPETPSSARHPSYQSNALPSLNHTLDPRHSFDHTNSHFDSRRSSVDSRMNVGMTHLALGPSSPYESQNASRVSLVSNLQQQRGITAEQRPNGASPLSPLGPRMSTGARGNHPPRRAPVINPNPRSVSGMPDPMAAAPTKGYAWAFPAEGDPEDRRGSTSGDSSNGRSIPSRQNSFATSVNSSIFTTDSAIPSAQNRYDPDIPTTHHHSMQHRSVTNLQPNHDSAAAGGNCSRTPELRVIHKMAERKRRSEMKNLFDELNTILPNSPGSKSSKWEILTKSIDHIKNLGRAHEAVRAENARLRPEAEFARRLQEENDLIRNELYAVWQQLRRVEPSHPHVYGALTGQFAQQQQPPPPPPPGTQNILPPIQQQQPQSQWGQTPTAMQGVEFAGGRPYEHR